MAVTPDTLAAAVAALAPEDLVQFVEALPRLCFAAFLYVADDRVWAERWARLPAPAPVVVTPAADPEEILTAAEAAAVLRISVDTLYSRVVRGELVPEQPRPRGGRLKFRRANLRVTPVDNGIDRRYSAPHDTLTRQGIAAPARLDTTRARRRAECHHDDRRAMGARGARRDAPRRGEPWAPGQGAWCDPQGDPRPKGDGA
jgi:hypothetical protein